MRRSFLGLAALLFVLRAAPAAAQETEPAPPPPPRPSILIDAKDELGHDVKAVTVYVDDAPFAYELDGKPLEVDPGNHVIRVQRNDGSRATATTSLLLHEGETRQPLHFVFDKGLPPPPREIALETESPPVLPRVVAGIGIAAVVTGVVFLLARPTMPINCNSDTSKCTKLNSETDAEFAEDRSSAQTNRDFLHAGLATLIAGAGVAVIGVTWYLLKAPKSRDAWSPRLQVGSGGVVFRAAF